MKHFNVQFLTSKYKSKFVLEITWMSGDADAYEKTKRKYREEQEDRLLETFNFLKKINYTDYEVRADEEDADHYSKIEGITEDVLSIFENAPPDRTVDGQWRASLDSIELFWYDDTGRKPEVTLK